MIWLVACFFQQEPTQTQKGLPDTWEQTGALHTAESSSVFEEGSLIQEAYFVADGNPKTSWCAKKGDSSAWVRMSSSCSGALLGLMFRNGFAESPAMFSQRDRVKTGELSLVVDGVGVWQAEVRFADTMQGQHVDFEDISCENEYTLELRVQERYEDVGPVCFSELQAMVSKDNPLEVIVGEGEQIAEREVPARINLQIYAGPSYAHTLIGYAPILLTEYGAPFVRVVEKKGVFFRFDRLRRRFTANEEPPELDDPSRGGWVHTNQLDWEKAFP